MDEATLRHQVELANFPAGVQIEHVPGPGLVLRASDGNGARGLEVQLTDEAARLYGEGPAVSVTLERLKQAAEAGLPEVHADGRFERLVFVGD